MDQTNSKGFATAVQQGVLDTIARQKDTKQHHRAHGIQQINPQVFQIATDTTLINDTANMTAAAKQQYLAARGQHDKRHLTVGPIQFTTKFSQMPEMTFGQGTQPVTGETSIPGQADGTVPFLIVPYVYSWLHGSGGEFAGFTLGLYALTAPPAGVSQHYIWWECQGQASRYQGQGTNESWTQSYDHNASSFLTT